MGQRKGQVGVVPSRTAYSQTPTINLQRHQGKIARLVCGIAGITVPRRGGLVGRGFK